MSRAAALGPRPGVRRRSAIPGFGLTLGTTLACLGLIVILPLAALVLKAAGLGVEGFAAALADPRVRSALRISFGLSLLAALTSSAFGFLVAWVLTRYDFPGRRLVDATVDLPFALPTAVAGIALAALYAPTGLVGAQLQRIGIQAAYTPVGIYIAMVFISLPFAVRTVQPLIAEIESETEEASATLGASRLTTLLRVVLPPLVPAVLTGFALAFARAVGEYGSIIFIAGNVAYVSEIAPLLIVIRLAEFDYAGAAVIATIMLAMSFLTLLAVNLIQAWSGRRFGHG